MRCLRRVIAVHLVFGWVAYVYADLTPIPQPGESASATAVYNCPAPASTRPAALADDGLWFAVSPLTELARGERVAILPIVPPDEHRANIRQLPPGPDSASLFLLAVGTFGALHLGRSFRKLHLNIAPEWYHAGGPAQVGHAKPIDLNSPALHLCCFEQPADEPPACRRAWRTRARPCRVQHFLTIAAPRGPPALSS